jgi:hypothetical protein
MMMMIVIQFDSILYFSVLHRQPNGHLQIQHKNIRKRKNTSKVTVNKL